MSNEKQYVVNKHHGTSFDIYAGRGSKWGNPFSHLENTKAEFKVETREDSILCHKKWFMQQPHLLEDLHELKEKVLQCFCHPLDCHCDFITDLVNNPTTVCFTGHRPNKLAEPCWNLNHPHAKYISEKLMPILIDLIINNKASVFISGGALGFDQIAFWTIHKLKKDYPHIKNIVAVPFKNQTSNWGNPESLKWYQKMIITADQIVLVDHEEKYLIRGVEKDVFHVVKLQKRNEYMVDQSDTIIACWDGSSGGTGNCIKYLNNKLNKKLIWLNPKKDYKIENKD